jgi:hypothetical protein
MNAKQIFNEIQGINPSTTTISSLGTIVTEQAQQVADSTRAEILRYLPQDTLAYKITRDADKLSDKQLWVIAYELVKNAEYCEYLAGEIKERQEYISYQKARKSAKNAAKRERKAEVKNQMKATEESNKNLVGNVRHNRFGEGVVVSEDDATITVNFKEYGMKTMVKKFTILERI